MKAHYTCQYCGHYWTGYFNTWNEPKCDQCKDTHIKVIRESDWDRDVFGYNKTSNISKIKNEKI